MDETNTDPGKWTLNVHEERPPSTESQDLCFTCDELLQNIIWPLDNGQDTDDDRVSNVGWVDRMASTDYCSLCQFFVRLLTSNHDVLIELCDERYRIVCFMSTGCEKLSENGVRLKWDLSVGFMENQEVETMEETRSLAQTNFPNVNFSLECDSLGALFGLERGLKEGEVVYHLGRAVEDDIPAEFLRDGFSTCKAHHGETCEMPKHVLKRRAEPEESTDLRFLRVIDVQQKCLVPLPTKATYVALSYTWSPEPYVSLLQENRHDLEIPGGIQVENLPPTIADAMAVVGMLGERFLWADRLCIVQDDPRDKRIQITQMDTVYRYATLTIVAAALSDGTRDVGLPGIKPGSRNAKQETTSIRGVTFVETKSQLQETIEQSRWSKQAWTFQEHLLSKRHLAFTPTRSVFLCAKDTFAEDYVRKGHPGTVANSQALTCQCETPDSTDDVHAYGIPSTPLAYEIMVRWYTNRSLTVESDTLKGVAGLLRTVTRETGHRFLCGMPMTNLLDHFLLRLPMGQSVRRGKNAFGLDFPSWSWAGWVGAAAYTITGQLLDGRAEVDFDEDPVVKSGYKVLMSKGGERYFPQNPEEIEDDVLLNLEWCKLCFIAPTARVQMSKAVWGYFTDCDSSEWGDVSRCQLLLVDSKFAGMVQLHMNKTRDELAADQATPEEALNLELRTVELVALSTTYRPWPVYFPISQYSRDDANFYYADKDGEEKDHLPFDTDVWDDEDPELVNVMMITWEGDLASRAGVGQIHADAWKMLGHEDKEIVLG